jgi:predicted Fe-Mo cluster-binding NifX family protein
MRVAIPFRDDRVSPVFDASKRLVVVDVEDGLERSRHQEILQEELPTWRARQLAQIGVNVLICGAISQPLAVMLAASGITVIPWTAGPVDEVLAAYLAGRLPDPRWSMPGCGRRQRHRGDCTPCS